MTANPLPLHAIRRRRAAEMAPPVLLLWILIGMERLVTVFPFVVSRSLSSARLHAPVGAPPSSRTCSRHNMFTGIVEEMGTVVSLETRDDLTLWDGSTGPGTELTVQGSVVLQGAYLGCSICVSGVCLTATELDVDASTFKVGLAPETLRKSNLGQLNSGDMVNLERASEIGGRNSGHFVQGHVDDIGEIVDKWADQDSLFFKIRVRSPDLLKYIVPKGFIAIDGTSLTVVDVNVPEQWFTFMLVAYTQSKIVVPLKNVGDTVNLEVDVLGKYSETALAVLLPRLESLEAKVETLERELKAQQRVA